MYSPDQRASPPDLANHPYLTFTDDVDLQQQQQQRQPPPQTSSRRPDAQDSSSLSISQSQDSSQLYSTDNSYLAAGK